MIAIGETIPSTSTRAGRKFWIIASDRALFWTFGNDTFIVGIVTGDPFGMRDGNGWILLVIFRVQSVLTQIFIVFAAVVALVEAINHLLGAVS